MTERAGMTEGAGMTERAGMTKEHIKAGAEAGAFELDTQTEAWLERIRQN